VGEPIATLANGDGAVPRAEPVAPPQPEAPPPRAAVAEPASESVPGRPVATPVARRTAVELGVSLHGISGTGPGGRITVDDVTRAAAQGESAPVPVSGKGEVTVHDPTPTQATIARRMLESATTIPVFTVSADVDVSEIVATRRDARDRGEDGPSLNDFVVKAAAATLREFPRFNASYVDGRVELYSRVNVGIAVATDDALLVPVVRDADRKSLAGLAEETRALADGARRRSLRPEDFHDGTFTVSNLGMFGVTRFTAILNPPEAAILAVGAVTRRLVPGVDDRPVARSLMAAVLTCDHRIVNGADGARFLADVRSALEAPLSLLG
jgi:pyruvate dehydrogenase E2 component (dihydrolipoamide acetyltransferase)